ncbi:MAG: hypothetical protein CMQ57_03590 [Gammaproteobacteria bacterium]|nr:hypothetical protein [Gammaproteobacteria bacterium]
MFKEISTFDSADFLEIIKNPSLFLFEAFELDLTNTEIYISLGVVLIFITGLLIDMLKPKEEIGDEDLPDNENGLKDIGSNVVLQKLDLAYAYVNMGKISLAKKIIDRLERQSLSQMEKSELNRLKNKMKND